MKKILTMMLCLLTLGISMVSCGGDDEPKGGKGLTGKWYVQGLPEKYSDDYSGSAYYFTNSNTVIYYNYISGSPRWEMGSDALKGPMQGYWVQSGCGTSYTYTVADNKVIIPMQGAILTIDGDRLVKDGGGTYTRKK